MQSYERERARRDILDGIQRRRFPHVFAIDIRPHLMLPYPSSDRTRIRSRITSRAEGKREGKYRRGEREKKKEILLRTPRVFLGVYAACTRSDYRSRFEDRLIASSVDEEAEEEVVGSLVPTVAATTTCRLPPGDRGTDPRHGATAR